MQHIPPEVRAIRPHPKKCFLFLAHQPNAMHALYSAVVHRYDLRCNTGSTSAPGRHRMLAQPLCARLASIHHHRHRTRGRCPPRLPGRPTILSIPTPYGPRLIAVEFAGRLNKLRIMISIDRRGQALDNVSIERRRERRRLRRTITCEDIYVRYYQNVLRLNQDLTEFLIFTQP